MQLLDQYEPYFSCDIFWAILVFKLLGNLVQKLRRLRHSLMQLLELIIAHVLVLELVVYFQSQRRNHQVVILTPHHIQNEEND